MTTNIPESKKRKGSPSGIEAPWSKKPMPDSIRKWHEMVAAKQRARAASRDAAMRESIREWHEMVAARRRASRESCSTASPTVATRNALSGAGELVGSSPQTAAATPTSRRVQSSSAKNRNHNNNKGSTLSHKKSAPDPRSRLPPLRTQFKSTSCARLSEEKTQQESKTSTSLPHKDWKVTKMSSAQNQDKPDRVFLVRKAFAASSEPTPNSEHTPSSETTQPGPQHKNNIGVKLTPWRSDSNTSQHNTQLQTTLTSLPHKDCKMTKQSAARDQNMADSNSLVHKAFAASSEPTQPDTEHKDNSVKLAPWRSNTNISPNDTLLLTTVKQSVAHNQDLPDRKSLARKAFAAASEPAQPDSQRKDDNGVKLAPWRSDSNISPNVRIMQENPAFAQYQLKLKRHALNLRFGKTVIQEPPKPGEIKGKWEPKFRNEADYFGGTLMKDMARVLGMRTGHLCTITWEETPAVRKGTEEFIVAWSRGTLDKEEWKSKYFQAFWDRYKPNFKKAKKDKYSVMEKKWKNKSRDRRFYYIEKEAYLRSFSESEDGSDDEDEDDDDDENCDEEEAEEQAEDEAEEEVEEQESQVPDQVLPCSSDEEEDELSDCF